MNKLISTTLEIKDSLSLLLPFLVLTAVLEFTGIAMIYPLINIMIDSNYEDQFIIYIRIAIEYIGLNYSANSSVVIIIAIFLFKFANKVIYRWIAINAVMNWLKNIRSKIYKNLFSSKFTEFNEKSNFLLNGLTKQSEEASGAIYQSIDIWASTITIFSAVVLANVISWKMFIILSIILLLLSLLFKKTLKYAYKYGADLTYSNKLFFGISAQAVNNYRYLKSTSTYDRFMEDFNPIIERIKNVQIKSSILNTVTSSLSEPLTVILISLILLFGSLFEYSKSTLLIEVIIIYRIFSVSFPLVASLQSFYKSTASLDYVHSISNSLSSKEFQKSDLATLSKINSVELSNISFSYDGENDVVKKININISENGLYSINGSSGAGKSTLLNLITGLLKSKEGVIKINGVNIESIDLKQYRSKIGFLSQSPVIFNFSIRDNLLLSSNSIQSDDILIKYLRDFQLESIFPNNKIDLSYVINELSTNISGGQKQRLALIREIIGNPSLLILDEPTSSLDQTTKEIINMNIKRLSKNCIVIAVTHDDDLYMLADLSFSVNTI
jgi:ABC-type bacteriocin/lantibiotic exporter with double-glycine peptidase domain